MCIDLNLCTDNNLHWLKQLYIFQYFEGITEISLKLQNIMEEAGVRAPVTAMPTAPPAASSDSDQPAAQSSQFQRLQVLSSSLYFNFPNFCDKRCAQ